MDVPTRGWKPRRTAYHHYMSSDIVLTPRTITALAKVITGDPITPYGSDRVAPYRTGPVLVEFFNECGCTESYPLSNGLSRMTLTKKCLNELNGHPNLVKAIEEALSPGIYRNTNCAVETAVDDLNPYLRGDGHEVEMRDTRYRVRGNLEGVVKIDRPVSASTVVDLAFIHDQIAKCSQKVSSGDFTGGITNARSLVEATLLELERRLDASPPQYEGDLPKLYNRVRLLLNLDPKQGQSQPFHMVLVGFSNVINGIAPMRNSMSDAHPLSYKPEKHHAKLAVNAAMTMADFLFGTYDHQIARGTLKAVAKLE